ncbi:MAG: 50S ribosomal protein L13 [Planctomycetota bacterium]
MPCLLQAGRLASRLALVLQGKHKPQYTPHVDTGDFVVVVNAEKIVLTRDKAGKKVYRRHTGWIGGLKEVSFTEMIAKHPERVIQLAVRRMLPKTRLGRKMFSKLKVYGGSEHPHTAQQPKTLEL